MDVLVLSAAVGACAALGSLKLPNTTIAARVVAAGAFTLPADAPRSDPSFFSAFKTLPAFCRVEAVATPARDSHIEFEVWLPESNWNGRYIAAGNGGYSGSINYYRLAEALAAGYASSATDAGHRGTPGDDAWSKGHPEKVIDFQYRAMHEMVVDAKAIMRAFYGAPVRTSYLNSCSNGGRQGLIEAEKYPADFDGVLAGAPAFDWNLGPDGDPSHADLKAFAARGGKVIMYHGAKDRPEPTVGYYRRLVSRLGHERVDDFLRLYVVPEMAHCGGGPFPDFGLRVETNVDERHSMSKALEAWVERGLAPGAIVATAYEKEGDRASAVLRTRALCPYPAVSCGGPPRH